jgi:hypothetical protein
MKMKLIFEFHIVTNEITNSTKSDRMSRPHGAAGKPAPERNIKAAPSFQEARKALVGILENLSFVKVVSVQPGKPAAGLSSGLAGTPYNGEAVELTFREAKDRPKLVFFDKFGRTRNLLKVGPITLAQAPLGPDHPSAVPTVGEVLVGSLVPNTRKSHLDHVLRGWSSDAKPLWELLRILRFGTKASEFEVRSILTQACSNLMQSPPNIKAVRDDIYMCARVILWGSVRPLQVLASLQNPGAVLEKPANDAELEAAKTLRISSTAIDFMDALTMKLNDASLSEALGNGLTLPEVAVVVDYGAPAASTDYQGWMRPSPDGGGPPGPPNGYGAPVWAAGGPAAPGAAGGGAAPPVPAWSWPAPAYDPAQNYTSAFRPLPAPKTPPIHEARDEAAGSPVYVPTSPVNYAPVSPIYNPTSPVNDIAIDVAPAGHS